MRTRPQRGFTAGLKKKCWDISVDFSLDGLSSLESRIPWQAFRLDVALVDSDCEESCVEERTPALVRMMQCETLHILDQYDQKTIAFDAVDSPEVSGSSPE